MGVEYFVYSMSANYVHYLRKRCALQRMVNLNCSIRLLR